MKIDISEFQKYRKIKLSILAKSLKNTSEEFYFQ